MLSRLGGTGTIRDGDGDDDEAPLTLKARRAGALPGADDDLRRAEAAAREDAVVVTWRACMAKWREWQGRFQGFRSDSWILVGL